MPPFTPRHGKQGLAYISTTAAGTLSLAKLSSWSLDLSTDTVEVTSFGDPNKTYVQGLKDLKGQISGFWNSDSDDIFDAADSSTGCVIQLYPCDMDLDTYWIGPAWLTASINVDVNDAVKITGNFVARGAWTHVP